MEEFGVKFIPLASGSKGNSTFIGTENTRILIDVGIACKKVEYLLGEIDEVAQDIDAIFITHEHSDHLSGCGVLSRKYDIPIYASKGVWEFIIKSNKIGEIKEHNMQIISSDENIYINELKVKAFNICHDANEPFGYRVAFGDEIIVVATDLGCVTEEVLDNLKGANRLLLESNHDVAMVKNGKYPYYLKQRVLSDFGHLSNESCGKFLVLLNDENLRQVYLGHLSEENNEPELALQTVVDILEVNGINIPSDLKVEVAQKEYICIKSATK